MRVQKDQGQQHHPPHVRHLEPTSLTSDRSSRSSTWYLKKRQFAKGYKTSVAQATKLPACTYMSRLGTTVTVESTSTVQCTWAVRATRQTTLTFQTDRQEGHCVADVSTDVGLGGIQPGTRRVTMKFKWARIGSIFSNSLIFVASYVLNHPPRHPNCNRAFFFVAYSQAIGYLPQPPVSYIKRARW